MHELAEYFHLPINDAAESLGLCTTALKKISRANGLNRWPHRKFKSINGMIESISQLLEASPEDADNLEYELKQLKLKREFLLSNPNASYKSVLPKSTINSLQARISRGTTSTTPISSPIEKETITAVKSAKSLSMSPQKTIQKKQLISNYGTRSKVKEDSFLNTSQEKVVTCTLATLKHRQDWDDVKLVHEFMENMKKLSMPDIESDSTSPKQLSNGNEFPPQCAPLIGYM